MDEEVVLEARIERKQDDLPRFVVVPAAAVAVWALPGTTPVELGIDGRAVGRRQLKRWDGERWFLDLPDALCRRAGVDTGAVVTLELRRASVDLPAELQALLDGDREARARWEALPPGRRAALRETVLAAARPATRTRRARRGLGLDS